MQTSQIQTPLFCPSFHRSIAGLFVLAMTSLGPVGCEQPAPVVLQPSTVSSPTATNAVGAQTQEPIVYELSFESRDEHLVDVRASFPTQGKATIEVMMAAWTPGSYKIRDYARHVEGVGAYGPKGEPLESTKVSKNRWRITTNELERVELRYRAYGRSLSVRHNNINEAYAVLNGAPTFMTLSDGARRRHEVRFNLPKGWRRVATQLKAQGGRKEVYVADDFDDLVDSPVLLGQVVTSTFRVGKHDFTVAHVGMTETWDLKRATADLKTIVETQRTFWGSFPFDNYVFLNVIASGGGGLEHKRSCLTIAKPWITHDDETYRKWLGLMSHEFFHAWNVRDLQPKSLVNLDYEHEQYTADLWLAEGITSYYDDLLLVRAGLLSEENYLKRLSHSVESVQTTPGRLTRSLAQSSFDAWIKFYQPDESSVNTDISYYSKGALVAWLLDHLVRQESNGHKSLDDVMVKLWNEHRDGGYRTEDFERIASEVAGTSLNAFFGAMVRGTDELGYDAALDYWGLRFKSATVADADEAEPDKPEMGAKIDEHGRIKEVTRGGLADVAGLQVDDELLAIDGFRLDDTEISTWLERFGVGKRVTLTLARRGKLVEQPLTIKAGLAEFEIEVVEGATKEQSTRRRTWLGIEEVVSDIETALPQVDPPVSP